VGDACEVKVVNDISSDHSAVKYNTLRNFLALVDFGDFFFKELVALLAELYDLTPFGTPSWKAYQSNSCVWQ
jgi:hypothetical protein